MKKEELLQRELRDAEEAYNQAFKRLAKIIKNADEAERDILLDSIAYNLGGDACEYISGFIRREVKK